MKVMAQSAVIVMLAVFCLCVVGSLSCWEQPLYIPLSGDQSLFAWILRLAVIGQLTFFVSVIRLAGEAPGRPPAPLTYRTALFGWLCVVLIIGAHWWAGRRAWDPDAIRFQHLRFKL